MSSIQTTNTSKAASCKAKHILYSRDQRPNSEPRELGGTNKRRRKYMQYLPIVFSLSCKYFRSFPRSFEASVNEDHTLVPMNKWKRWKSWLLLLIMSVAVIILVISVLVSAFRFTRITTFYHLVKKKLWMTVVRIIRILNLWSNTFFPLKS